MSEDEAHDRETEPSLRDAVAPYSRRPFVPDMRVGIAMMQDSLELPERVDEAMLAAALREVVPEADGYVGSFLAMIADALDSPDAEYRLRIVRNRRGRPPKADTDADYMRAEFVEARMRAANVPLKAAVMDAMEQFDCSRATVFRALKRWRSLMSLAAELDLSNLRGGDSG
jgi:hypothetical protein